MTKHDDAAVLRLKSYVAPSRAVVVVHPEAPARDRLARLLAPYFEVSSYPDLAGAIGRTLRPPAAIVLGAVPASGGRTPVAQLRKEPVFRLVPVVATSRDDEADATVANESDLVAVIWRLANRQVENGWETLPDAPREALKRSLKVFNGFADLIGNGKPLDVQAVSDACRPVLDSVREASHRTLFEGLRNHNELLYVHSLRVATLLGLFGYTIGLDEDSLMVLTTGGLLHDMGRATLPPDMVNKPGPLSAPQMQQARGHVDTTVRYLEAQPDLPRGVVAIAAQHHERIDGSGYPHGLANEQLNNLARMAAIVDVFAALTEQRPYRAPMSPFQALEVMQENIRSALDQSLVRLFRGMLLDAA